MPFCSLYLNALVLYRGACVRGSLGPQRIDRQTRRRDRKGGRRSYNQTRISAPRAVHACTRHVAARIPLPYRGACVRGALGPQRIDRQTRRCDRKGGRRSYNQTRISAPRSSPRMHATRGSIHTVTVPLPYPHVIPKAKLRTDQCAHARRARLRMLTRAGARPKRGRDSQPPTHPRITGGVAGTGCGA